MTTGLSDDRVDALVRARRATARVTQAETATALARFAPAGFDPRGWSEAIAAAFARTGGDAGPWWRGFGLTAAVPWKRLVERVVPGLGLGVEPGDAKAHARLADRDAWAAAIVARAHGLWTGGSAGPPPTLAAVCDALVWRGVGLTGTPKRTPPELRAHFANRVLGEGEGAHDRAVRLLAAREVGAVRADLRALRDALGRRWLVGQEWGARESAQERPPAPEPAGAPDLTELARAVRSAARDATDGVFGERKVFIASLWRSLAGRPPVGQMDLAVFKARLVDAHRAGLVSLVRADLVGVMDPAQVAASEAVSGDARYHFVVREVAS